jgi:hypothetical protein
MPAAEARGWPLETTPLRAITMGRCLLMIRGIVTIPIRYLRRLPREAERDVAHSSSSS